MEPPKNEKPANTGDAFSEYMWMGTSDEFDFEAEKQIEEELYIHSCIEKLLEEEEQDTVYFDRQLPQAVNGSDQGRHNYNNNNYMGNGHQLKEGGGLDQAMLQCNLNGGDEVARYQNNPYSVDNRQGTHFYSHDERTTGNEQQANYPPYGSQQNWRSQSQSWQNTNTLNPHAQEFVPGKPYNWSQSRQQVSSVNWR